MLMVPRVAIKYAILSLVTRRPLTRPMNAPNRITTPIAR